MNLRFKVYFFIDLKEEKERNDFITELKQLRSETSKREDRLPLTRAGFKALKGLKKIGLTALYHERKPSRDKFTFYFTNTQENPAKEKEILEFFRNVKEDCEVIWSKDERLK